MKDLSHLMNDLDRLFSFIKTAARTLGKELTRLILTMYFVLREGDLTSSEKLMIWAAIIYVLVPGDFLPRRVFKMLGLTDDALAIAFVIKKVHGRITPHIEQKVSMQLDKWFGYDIARPGEE